MGSTGTNERFTNASRNQKKKYKDKRNLPLNIRSTTPQGATLADQEAAHLTLDCRRRYERSEANPISCECHVTFETCVATGPPYKTRISGLIKKKEIYKNGPIWHDKQYVVYEADLARRAHFFYVFIFGSAK